MGLHSSSKGTFPSYQTAINSCSTKTIYNKKEYCQNKKYTELSLERKKEMKKWQRMGTIFKPCPVTFDQNQKTADSQQAE